MLPLAATPERFQLYKLSVEMKLKREREREREKKNIE
jgi:hypothetical protein